MIFFRSLSLTLVWGGIATSPHTPLAVTDRWKDESGLGMYADFVMETDWAEDRSRIPGNWIRNTVGQLLRECYLVIINIRKYLFVMTAFISPAGIDNQVTSNG